MNQRNMKIKHTRKKPYHAYMKGTVDMMLFQKLFSGPKGHEEGKVC